MSRTQAEDDDVFLSSSQQQYRKIMNENLNGDIFSQRIIGYHQKPPENDGMRFHSLHLEFGLSSDL